MRLPWLVAFNDDETQFIALIKGSQEDYGRAKVLISENGQMRESFKANGSFDGFIVALLEDTTNENRYRQIYRVQAIMRGNECMTPLAEVALGIGYLHYGNSDVIGHIQALLIQPDFQTYPQELAHSFRAQGKETVASLVENFADQMASVKTTGNLLQLSQPGPSDKKV